MSRENPYSDFALEEAIFRAMKGMTVRVWWNRLSVIIGRAQLAHLETDVDYCATYGIPIVRRFTAGGAVYNGPGNVNWSFFLPSSFARDGLKFTWDATGVFRMISAVVIRALERCGVRTWLETPNRIVNAEGKVGGMAAYISRDGLLCHGTLLCRADLDELRRLTTPSREAAEKRYVRSNSTKVVNTGIGAEEFARRVSEVLLENAGVSLQKSAPSTEEINLERALYAERYGRREWNMGDPFAFRGS